MTTIFPKFKIIRSLGVKNSQLIKLFMVQQAFSGLIKCYSVFDSPKTGLIIPGEFQLANDMVCVTTIFKLCDQY